MRHVQSAPENQLRFGAKKACSKTFREPFKQIFKLNVLDPERFLRNGWNKNNLCLPTCVLISLHKFVTVGQNKFRPTLAQLENEIGYLRFTELLKKDLDGISLNDLSKFERLNTPFSPELRARFPVTNLFKGLSVNVFRIDYSNHVRTHRIFPLKLSDNYRDMRFWQVDVLADDCQTFYHQQKTDGDGRSTVATPNHFLFISNICWILQSFTQKFSNRSLYKFCCRACMQIFRSMHLLVDHQISCDAKHASSSSSKVYHRRQSKNMLIHRPYTTVATNVKIKNGLRFERSKLKNMLMNLSTSTMDFECTNSNEEIEDALGILGKVPRTAIFFQNVCGVSIAHRSNYEDFELPASLSVPRSIFRDESVVSDEDFFLSILLQIRRDHCYHHKFLDEAIQSDFGRPQWSALSVMEKIFFHTKTVCSLCGRQFGKLYKNTNSKKVYRLKKVWVGVA